MGFECDLVLEEMNYYFDGKIAIESDGVDIASMVISSSESSIDSIVEILHLIFEKLNLRRQEMILSTHLPHFRILIYHAIQRKQVNELIRSSNIQRENAMQRDVQ